MGETFAEVILRANGKKIKKRLLVDTGSTYSWIDSSTLKKLNVKPLRIHSFVTIEGKGIKKRIGEVEVECMGNKAHTIVGFGEKKNCEVVGLHCLEGLALEVDPLNQKLRRSKAIKAL